MLYCFMNEDQLFLNSQLTLTNLEANTKEKLVAHMRECFIYQYVCKGRFACVFPFCPVQLSSAAVCFNPEGSGISEEC